jgi:hypothetical protein
LIAVLHSSATPSADSVSSGSSFRISSGHHCC